ncbi:flagellar basal-body MS-ring/collar protein FliF [Dyella nitratireducens]|uniref:Flagellar M-ring protein n=1 Tax=Dyella nitratireducens TaxID=1849580 RepID=A0ABQ1FT04_9GAMM|nr:flagellar basal-body MS-ring/collar protein FliF [Dyella nitratireducens]GGA27587.1 flagellar M-ring protein [Dyella nitratireducens]GLQ43394.1 flagellar M-ring protein [Dyella nitratireducens]
MADNIPATANARQDQLKTLLRNPTTRLLMLLVGVAMAVALGVGIVLWSRGPNYALLYAGLDPKDAAAVTQALQTSNTPFRLGADGASISVPADVLADTRLKLAAQGLPQGSTAGATMPQSDSPFGMSDLAESTRYREMLETDLGNTIAGLQFVRAARVHLALPKPSAFIRDNHPASASVLLTLYPGRQLDSSQVQAIVHLVSSSVPDLDPSQVSVVDQQGTLLTGSDPNSPGAVGDAHMRLVTRMENSYAQRIETLLTPLVGPGRVRAQVDVALDFSETEKASESYDGDKPALRSEQTSSDTKHDDNSGQIAGALSNQPPNTVAQPTAAKPNAGTPPAANAAASNTTNATPTDTSSSATRNYELGRTISHVTDPAGRMTRLTVAVVVDNKPALDGKGKSIPLTAQELQHLTDLTKNAVGYDQQRGDSVTVINQAFSDDAAASDTAPAAQPFWMRPGMLDLIKQGAGILIAVLIAFGLLRPLLKGLLRGPEPVPALAGPIPTVSVRIADDDRDERNDPVRITSPQIQNMAYEQKIGLARKLVQENSKQVAQVVMNWVGEDGS